MDCLFFFFLAITFYYYFYWSGYRCHLSSEESGATAAADNSTGSALFSIPALTDVAVF